MTQIGRGIQMAFAEQFKNSLFFQCYLKHQEDLFLGIRNQYINLYYRGLSIAKVERDCKRASIAKRYLGIDQDGYQMIDDVEFLNRYSEIQRRVDKYSEKGLERQAQQQLILNNNRNAASAWYCIDMEYVIQLPTERSTVGRNDILALSKDGKRVAMIELKYGSHSLGNFPKHMEQLLKEHRSQIQSFTYEDGLGNGILGHIYDMVCCLQKNYYEQYVKPDLSRMIKSYHLLGLASDLPAFSPDQLASSPEKYFIILDNQENAALRSTQNYLYAAQPGSSKYNLASILGTAVLEDITFLFSSDRGDQIHSIIDDTLYQRYCHQSGQSGLIQMESAVAEKSCR